MLHEIGHTAAQFAKSSAFRGDVKSMALCYLVLKASLARLYPLMTETNLVCVLCPLDFVFRHVVSLDYSCVSKLH